VRCRSPHLSGLRGRGRRLAMLLVLLMLLVLPLLLLPLLL
jgi:hypothetical protein